MKITAEKIRQWRNDADGFFQWLEDVKPMVAGPSAAFVPFELCDFQREAIRSALAREGGHWKYQTIVFSFPRRHSKTTLMALLVLWRFLLFPNQNIKVLSNSQQQSQAVSFGMLKKIIRNTPFLLEQVGLANIHLQEIRNPKLQSLISVVANNASTLYGEKVTCAWVSEIHAAESDEALQVLASSLGDSEDSWLLIDSTVDATGGPIHRLEQLQETGKDPTVFVRRIEYRNLEEALEKSPQWISRRWLKGRSAQLLPVTFSTQHLNQRAASTNCLFALDKIQACVDPSIPEQVTAEGLATLAAGRRYVVGGGLDRAYFASLHGDQTIWTSLAKIADADGGEPHYYVLNQQSIFGSLGSGIKKAILRDNSLYSFANITIEQYNSQDIALWAQEQGITCELISPTASTQTPAFTHFYQIVAEGRLHFSAKLKDLVSEMQTFQYELRGDRPKFGNDKFHDDRVYSLAWAIFSLRTRELSAYSLPDIQCDSRSPHAALCYLRTGELIMPCSQTCPAHKLCEGMFLQYKSQYIESELTLPEFFQTRVTVAGVRSYRAL